MRTSQDTINRYKQSSCLSVALCVSVQLSAVQVSVSGLLPLHVWQRCQLRQRQPSAAPLPNGEGDPTPPRHGRLQWLRRKRGEPERKRLCSVFTVRNMNRYPLFSSAADQRRAGRASAVGRWLRPGRGIFQRGRITTNSVCRRKRAGSTNTPAPPHPAALQIQVLRRRLFPKFDQSLYLFKKAVIIICMILFK